MKIPKSIDERRKSIRVDHELPFKIGHKDYEIQAKTVNIGLHGALCEVDRDIALMTQLNLAICLPDAKTSRVVEIKGVVVRKELHGERYLIAIFFSDIKPKDSELLKGYLYHQGRA